VLTAHRKPALAQVALLAALVATRFTAALVRGSPAGLLRRKKNGTIPRGGQPKFGA